MKGRSHGLQSHDPHDDWVDGSWTVDCVCGVDFDDGEEMVNCDECGVWVHTRCSRYVKGDELFTCDKCKRKNNRNDSEETEVAQLLVELPMKTIRLDSSYAANGPLRRPFRLWTDIPMEERVHVQGIPGGDPALFGGLSSVFSPELWKCTGYVPKKLNFQYREFPCWDEEEGGTVRDEEENENTVDKGAGVLFSLSKERVLATSGTTMVGMRGTDDKVGSGRNLYSKEMKKWDGEDGKVRHLQVGTKKDRSLLRSVVIHSGKQNKEDLVTSKDGFGKKKARATDEVDAEQRGSYAFKTAFTSTSDAKLLEYCEDKGQKPFKNNSQSTNSKNLWDSVIQKRESDSFFALGNCIENPKNSTTVEHCSEALSSDFSRNNFSTGARLKEGKASHEVPTVIECPPKIDTVAVSAPEHSDIGEIPIKQEGDAVPNDNLHDNVEVSAGSDVNPQESEEHASAASEDNRNDINGDSDTFLNSVQSNVKVEIDDDNSRVCQHSVGDAKHEGIYYGNMSENSKKNDATLSGSPSSDHKAQEVDITSEAVCDSHTDKVNVLTGDACQLKKELEGSEASTHMKECPSKSGHSSRFAEELSNSGGTILNSVALSTQHKVCVRKSSSTLMIAKASASDNLRSVDTLADATQQVTTESNAGIKKDRTANDIVRHEEKHDMSRRTVKERPKSSVNSASKVSNPSKISHASVPKRTFSDSKDSVISSSLKASSAQNSSENAGSLQNECASHVQNKVPTSGVPPRGEKFNSQSSFKANHVLSTNTSASTNSAAALSDEELALLLHQELNSSPRVPRVPRVRHAGCLPQLASSTATSMLLKRTSSSGGKDRSLVSRRKNKDASKDGFRCSLEPDDESKKTENELRRQDTGRTADTLSKKDDNRSPAAVNSIKKNILPASTSTANSGPSSSAEVNDHHLPSIRSSPRNISDEETGTGRGPVHRTLPGLINEIMSKGKRMTYEELCNAVLPHWHNLRKHNGERYAYSSHSQAVLDCLRNRHEWAQLVDRGPKTNSSRKRRKPDDDSEDNEYGKEITGKDRESRSLESQREEFPKGKRKARKRRRLALQGRGIKDVRKRQKPDSLTDDDSETYSKSSEESLFSDDETQGGAGSVGCEASASSDETGTM